MEVKLFELRDVATFIPTLGVRLKPRGEQERYLLGRSGYGTTPTDQMQYVLLMKLSGGVGQMSCDPHEWDSNTMRLAHEYIIKHWYSLASGNVIDVEYLAGISPESKESENPGAPDQDPPEPKPDLMKDPEPVKKPDDPKED